LPQIDLVAQCRAKGGNCPSGVILVAVETAVNRGLDAAVQRLKQRDDRQR
jgi:hypothetical protein